MKDQISDEQLDLIAKRLVQEFSADESVLDEIAGSPQFWWGVKRRIAAEETKPAYAWISSWLLRITAFAALAMMIIGVAFWSLRSTEVEQANTAVPAPEAISEKPTDQTEPGRPAVIAEQSAEKLPANRFNGNNARPTLAKVTKNRMRPRSVVAAEEIKTDFIALSYAQAPESGQIIKVKVPRSMMTSLGVASGSDNGSELVNAEVIVGDDGAAHAIRFIRGS